MRRGDHDAVPVLVAGGALAAGRAAGTWLSDVAVTLVGGDVGVRLLCDGAYENYLRDWLDHAI